MAVPEPNNPYVITVANIDPALQTLHADIHYWLTERLQEEDKTEYKHWEGCGQSAEKKGRG